MLFVLAICRHQSGRVSNPCLKGQCPFWMFAATFMMWRLLLRSCSFVGQRIVASKGHKATKLGHSWSHGHSHHMVTIRGIQLGGLALSMLFHRKRARGRKLCRKPFLYYGDRSSILNAGWRFCAPLPCFSHAKRVRGHCAENRCDDRIVDYLTLGGASVHGL